MNTDRASPIPAVKAVRYLARLPPHSPTLLKWEEKLHEKMVTMSGYMPLRPRNRTATTKTDQGYRISIFTAIETALTYSVENLPPTPYPMDHIQMLLSVFSAPESELSAFLHTGHCERLAAQMNSGNWAEVFYTISHSLPASESTHDANRKRAVQNSVPYWTESYGGDALNGLVEKLRSAEANFISKRYYSKTVDIIQSSGCGKSRLVAEAGKLMLQISFPLRYDQDTGFPPGDPEVFSFLTGGRMDYQNTHGRAIAFLAASISSILRWYHKHFQHSMVQLRDVLARWNSELNTPMEGSLDGLSDFRPQARIQFCKDWLNDANQYFTLISRDFAPSDESGVWDWEENFDYERNPVFQAIVLKPLATLLTSLPSPEDDLLPQILLGIDEAGNLLNMELDGSLQNLRITAIRRAFRALRTYRIWAVFLSTNGRMEMFTTSRASDSSSRVESGRFIRISPVVAFELHVEERRRRMADWSEQFKPMTDYTTVEHKTGFGRPLWRLYSARSYTSLLDFVQTKLLGGGNIEYTPTNPNHAFAAISSRVTLNPSENRESIQLAWTAIHYHLRILVSVNVKNGSLLTTTASEPVVSDAAANLLMQDQATKINWVPTLHTLANNLLNSGMVGRGTRGELYCQLMPIIARDLLLFEKITHQTDLDFPMSRLFTYKEFLDTLLGTDVASNAFSSQIEAPLARFQNRMGTTHLIEEGYCNFNHFVFTNQDLNPETFGTLLLDLLRSNAALQLSHGQDNWDQIIPVYFGNPATSVDPAKIGGLFIQAKNRIEAESIRLFPADFGKYLPAGALAIHLQIEAGVEAFKQRTIRAPMPVFTPKKIEGMRRATQPFVLGIQVYGHHIQNFPFLNKRVGLFEATKAIVDGIKIPRLGVAGQVQERLWGHHPLGSFSPAHINPAGSDGDVEMTQPEDVYGRYSQRSAS